MPREDPQLEDAHPDSQSQGPPLSPPFPLRTEVPGPRPRAGAPPITRHDIVIACMFRESWPLLRNRQGFSGLRSRLEARQPVRLVLD